MEAEGCEDGRACTTDRFEESVTALQSLGGFVIWIVCGIESMDRVSFIGVSVVSKEKLRRRERRGWVCCAISLSEGKAWGSKERWDPEILGRVVWKGLSRVARLYVIRQAEAIGIPWREYVRRNETRHSDLERAEEELKDIDIEYPGYYLHPFHAYEDGNMGWLATYEVEPATLGVSARFYREEIERKELTPIGSQILFREKFLEQIEGYHGAPPSTMLDVGASACFAAEHMAKRWSEASIVAIDLSPRFLALGQVRLMEAGLQDQVELMHANAEDLQKIEAESVDCYTSSMLFHELPSFATRNALVEAFRVLKPGGTIAITDSDPDSWKKIPKLVWKMMLLTEPFQEEYTALNFHDELQAVGFIDTEITLINYRHRIILGRKALRE